MLSIVSVFFCYMDLLTFLLDPFVYFGYFLFITIYRYCALRMNLSIKLAGIYICNALRVRPLVVLLFQFLCLTLISAAGIFGVGFNGFISLSRLRSITLVTHSWLFFSSFWVSLTFFPFFQRFGFPTDCFTYCWCLSGGYIAAAAFAAFLAFSAFRREMAMSNFSKCLVMVLSLLCNTDKYADLCLDVNMLDGDIIFLLLMEVEAVVVDPYSGPAAIPSLFAGVIPGSALPSPLVHFCSNALPASILEIVALTASSPFVTPTEECGPAGAKRGIIIHRSSVRRCCGGC